MPVPDQYGISTPYGRRGPYWSCNENASGDGIHTGDDFAAPAGTPLYATIAGEIRHRNYGSAFGGHQFAISPDPGQPFADGEVFYAHARKRLPDGTRVKPGDWVGEVGSEGNATGPHLHYEFHPNTKNAWNCSVHANPGPTYREDDDDMPSAEEIGKAVAKHVWKDDIVPSDSPDNETWMAGTYLKVYLRRLDAITEDVAELTRMVRDLQGR
jgi:murein DD-endopeptidase MepM/ murein hydrolase activator NlpD